MAKLTNTQVMERMTDAELRAIYRVFGARPKVETEVCRLRNYWYYFMNDFKFNVGGVPVHCRIFRERFIDVPSTEYHITGFINYSPGRIGNSVSIKGKLNSPDDDATIERIIRKAINKTFGKIKDIY